MSQSTRLSQCPDCKAELVNIKRFGRGGKSTFCAAQGATAIYYACAEAKRRFYLGIFKTIMAAGLSRAIIRVQIKRAGVLQLGAYDNFHPEYVVTGPEVHASLLSELQSAGVLRSFPAASVSKAPNQGPSAYTKRRF